MDNQNFDTGMYIIDENYKIIYCNEATKELYPDAVVGCNCYNTIALREDPCSLCPVRDGNILFYTPLRKEWVSAQAASLEVPNHGRCYNVQFQIRSRKSSVREGFLPEETVAEYVAEMQAATGNVCAIATYVEPGSPIFYANDEMVELLGYDSMIDLFNGIDGLVVNLMHPDDRASVKADIKDPYTVGATFETKYRMPRKDGSWIWTVTKGKIVKTASGKLAVVSVCADMNEFLKYHEELQEKNRKLIRNEILSEEIIDQIPGGYHRCGAGEDYPFIYISKSFEEAVGWTKEEIEEQFDNKFINLVWEEDIPIFNGLVDDIEQKNQGSVMYRIKKKGGGYRWVQDSTMFVKQGDKEFYQCTLADVTHYIEELDRQRKELEIAKQRAEASSRAKSTFLFNASHDIRTPMNAIQGFTHILEQNINNKPLVSDIIGKMKKSSDMLMKLLNDVLELSRIESGKDELDLKITNLHDVEENLYMMFQQDMERAGIVFDEECMLKDKLVYCDELKITQIVMNMLSNSKKFTAEGGTVTFGIEQLPCEEEGFGNYRLFVRDTGIGMSKEFQERAFEQFERERTSTDSGVSGSGLGMAIIKKLVDLMGGTCILNSELGKGTEIAVNLKFKIANKERIEDEKVSDKLIDLSGKRVLLVEDNEFNREIARYILEDMGMLVEEACDGAMAVSKLISENPDYYDVIMMDIQMPVMDGYTATQEIRRLTDFKLASTPIIAMTANAFKEDREKCLEVGMNEHIGKPVEAKALLHALSKVLKKQ